ncbi:MAG TPA: aminopeptidase [Anaerolineae bacterium]|nr:aminopeptidase [Anaerolineae bacterium]
MIDSRVIKLAQVITGYSVSIRKGDRVYLTASPVAQPLTLAVIEEVIKRGGLPHISGGSSYHHLDLVPGAMEALLKYGSDEQIHYLNPFERMAISEFEVRIAIKAETNTKSLMNVDPQKMALMLAGRRELNDTFMRRQASDELDWVVTLFPTEAYAQDAAMSLHEYEDFVYGACLLDQPDPVAAWEAIATRQRRLVEWLKGKRRVQVKGPNCDLVVGIDGRVFVSSEGKKNMPDGEIFTGPEETLTEGWVKFTYPAIYQGHVVEGAELEFKAGRVVKAGARKGQDFFISVLDTDAGARTLGEFAIGTNTGIQKFTGNILFDEKIGGTIHLAVGAGYPNTGSKNVSAVHWDLICDTRDGTEITVDGAPFYRSGEFLVK